MKHWIIVLLLIVQCPGLDAQSPAAGSEVVSLLKLDLGLQGIGFNYESALSNSFTAELATGISGGYEIDKQTLTYRFDFFKPAFYFSFTPKYFYNRRDRPTLERKTELNSGNYIGMRVRYLTPEAGGGTTVNCLLTNLHWGMQRAIGRSWTMNLHAGVGYAASIGTTFNHGTFYPALDLRFAYIFLKSQPG